MIPGLRSRVPVVAGIVVLLAVAGVIAARSPMFRLGPAAIGTATAVARLPDLADAAGWLNGGPLTADSLRGHPVVVVLWSDTDPRSLEALPVVESWHAAFARFGVRVVGVHEPDYSFGSDPEVPARVARRLGLSFPIALDPQYHIRLDAGPGRPVVVVADTSGRIVFTAGGDGLADVDRVIRDQVRMLHPETGFPADPGTAAARAAVPVASTRFAFLGTARATGGPLAGAQPGRTLTFTAQFRFQEEGEPLVPHPVGRWTPSAEGLTAERGGAMNYVAIRCGPGRGSVVLRPPEQGSARVWILENDAWLPPESRDEDVKVDARGATYVDVTEPRLYRITRGSASERILKLSPDEPGVTVYAFAFEPEDREGAAAGSARSRP